MCAERAEQVARAAGRRRLAPVRLRLDADECERRAAARAVPPDGLHRPPEPAHAAHVEPERDGQRRLPERRPRDGLAHEPDQPRVSRGRRRRAPRRRRQEAEAARGEQLRRQHRHRVGLGLAARAHGAGGGGRLAPPERRDGHLRPAHRLPDRPLHARGYVADHWPLTITSAYSPSPSHPRLVCTLQARFRT